MAGHNYVFSACNADSQDGGDSYFRLYYGTRSMEVASNDDDYTCTRYGTRLSTIEYTPGQAGQLCLRMGCYNNYLCSYLVTCTDNGQPCGGTIPDPPPDVPTDDEDYDKDTISIVINDAADSISTSLDPAPLLQSRVHTFLIVYKFLFVYCKLTHLSVIRLCFFQTSQFKISVGQK